MIYVSIHEDDMMQFHCDAFPEQWHSRLYEVTSEERDEIIRLKAEGEKLQALLEAIRGRPELDFYP